MEVLFHFIFELVKISLLAGVYGTMVLLLFKLIARFRPQSWFAKISRKGIQLWFWSDLIIAVVLFLYMFSYWGDHGLGDSARVPIGHFKDVRQSDGAYSYIQSQENESIGIKRFTFDKNNFYGEAAASTASGQGQYLVWDLNSGKVQFFTTADDYQRAVGEKNYAPLSDFREFWPVYRQHWQGWRFWMLP